MARGACVSIWIASAASRSGRAPRSGTRAPRASGGREDASPAPCRRAPPALDPLAPAFLAAPTTRRPWRRRRPRPRSCRQPRRHFDMPQAMPSRAVASALRRSRPPPSIAPCTSAATAAPGLMAPSATSSPARHAAQKGSGGAARPARCPRRGSAWPGGRARRVRPGRMELDQRPRRRRKRRGARRLHHRLAVEQKDPARDVVGAADEEWVRGVDRLRRGEHAVVYRRAGQPAPALGAGERPVAPEHQAQAPARLQAVPRRGDGDHRPPAKRRGQHRQDRMRACCKVARVELGGQRHAVEVERDPPPRRLAQRGEIRLSLGHRGPSAGRRARAPDPRRHHARCSNLGAC